MKNFILLLFLLLITQLNFSQSLKIYKNDQTTVDFELTKIDSITFSVTTSGMALELGNWECITFEPSIRKVKPATGVYEKVSEGLKIFGSENQGGRAIHLAPVSRNLIMNKIIYIRWKVNGSGNFINVGISLYVDTVNWISSKQVMNLTTQYSSEGSDVIVDDVWYYTRIVVTSNLVASTTATGNYDSNEGIVVQTLSTTLNEPVAAFTFGMNASTKSYAILGDVRIE